MTVGLIQDIFEQPNSLRQLLANGWISVAEAARRIHGFRPEWVFIAARGTSDNAARYAQHLFGAYNRLGVGLASPSLFAAYGKPPNISRALTIGISQSGHSDDVVSILAEANRQGGLTLAFTNDATSPLAQTAALCIKLSALPERSPNPTMTYINQLMALAMLSVALERSTDRWDDLSLIPAQLERVCAQEATVAAAAQTLADKHCFAVVGQGFNYCTTWEVALKLGQTADVAAMPYSAADLLGGPLAIIEKDFPLIFVSPSGATQEQHAPLLRISRNQSALRVVISDQLAYLSAADIPLPLPPGTPEWLSPLIAVVPGQLLACHLAMARGLDPDVSRGGSLRNLANEPR